MHNDPPPLDAPLPETPFSADLRAALDAVYDLAPSHVPRTLVVCRCPVCMSGGTLAQILATPTRSLTPDLVREYTNSAHGDPTDPDDLNALLPRYLDLIAQDISVDWNSVGADLRRFGDARGNLPGFPAPGMGPVLDLYAQHLLGHFAALQVQGAEPIETPWSLLPFLVIGGWPVAPLTETLDGLFQRPDFGPAALVWFLEEMGRQVRDGRLDLWAFSRYRPEAAPALAAWLNRLLTSEAATAVMTDPSLPENIAVWVAPLASLGGQITPAILGFLAGPTGGEGS
ncbi:MAG: hypothetical protein HC783_15475 [Rhodobacteraceae bacterium]|nr:hypothetical protein [Paracoccaceae bacterium]